MQSNGWLFENLTNDMSQCMPFTSVVPDVCGGRSKWYGWGCGNKVGIISTTLRGSGTVTLHYGNCWNAGMVNVYLNNTRELSSLPSTTVLQSFDYHDGEELEIREEDGNGIIQLIDISFTCKGTNPKCNLLSYLFLTSL